MDLKYRNNPYAFNNSVSRTFVENQCSNAANETDSTYKKYECSKTMSTDDTLIYYMYSEKGMSADYCKSVCIATCSFKYAALSG